MKPGLTEGGWGEVPRIDLGEIDRAVEPAIAVIRKRFAVVLLNQSETAKLAFFAIPVAVAIAVLGGQLSLGNFIDDLHARHGLYRKRQGGSPARRDALPVFQVEADG